MIDIKVLIAILVIHWIADFVLQTDKQAKGKSENWDDLLNHTFSYSAMWMIAVLLLNIGSWSREEANIFQASVFEFVMITFVCHTIQDYFTSRLNSRLFKAKKRYEFFVSVGFDQLLHYIQLVLTYQLLS